MKKAFIKLYLWLRSLFMTTQAKYKELKDLQTSAFDSLENKLNELATDGYHEFKSRDNEANIFEFRLGDHFFLLKGSIYPGHSKAFYKTYHRVLSLRFYPRRKYITTGIENLNLKADTRGLYQLLSAEYQYDSFKPKDFGVKYLEYLTKESDKIENEAIKKEGK